MGLIGRAVRAAVIVAGIFALVDLWQIAILNPASLQPAGALWLLLLYVGTAFGAALVPLFVLSRWRGGWAPYLVLPGLLGCGVWLILQEVGLRSLQPLSPWRTPVVGAALVAGLGTGFVLARRVRPRRWTWAASVGGLLLALGLVGAVRGFTLPQASDDGPGAAVPTAAPNVVVVLIDTLRADHLSCYGYERPTSPAIDRFATESVLFTRAFSQSTWTKPATASLFTGRYPSQHGAYLEKARLPDTELLLPEAFGQIGYRTAVFSGNPWITPDYGFDQGVDDFYSVYDERFARVTLYMMTLKRLSKALDRGWTYNRVKMLVLGEFSTTERDAHLNREIVRWLDEHGQRPFFMHVHYMSPHHPYDPPAPFDRFVPDPSLTPVTYYPKKSYFFFEEGEELPAAQRADMVARYDGDILFVDGVFDDLLATLRARDLLDRTVVVLTSDHGEEFFDHRNWGHGQSVYNELTHVPLIVRHPALFPPGTRVASPVMTVDVMPTVLELAGAAPPHGLAGRSLLPLLAPGALATPRESYSELLYRYGHAQALVRDESKLVRMTKGDESRTALYDLRADFGEHHDLASDATARRVLEERLTAVESWSREHQGAAPAEVEIDGEMANRLKALGYLE
jgi:arylsulfatase A-like enzyme